VISIVDYGVFVRVRDGIEALVASGDVLEEEGKKIKVGDKVRVEISNLDTADRRITATMKNVRSASSPPPPQREVASRGGTLGDLIKEKLGDKLDETIKR
jgi:small subunit ribosomal protein S1